MGDRISYLRYTLNTEPMSHLKRRNRLRKLIDADAMLVSNEINVRYLTGFTGDSSLLIVRSSGEDELVSDPRYEEQIAEECPGLATFIRQPSQRTFDVVCQRLDAMEIAQLVVEANSLTMSLFERLQALTQVESFLSGAGEVEQLRAIKDKSEIKIIRDAVQIAERAFRIFREQLMPHQTEKELAYELASAANRAPAGAWITAATTGRFGSVSGPVPRAPSSVPSSVTNFRPSFAAAWC